MHDATLEILIGFEAETPEKIFQDITENNDQLKKLIKETEEAKETVKIKNEEYLKQVKCRIENLCQGIENLTVKADGSIVKLHIKLGELLHHIKSETYNNKPNDYANWIKDNFKNKHKRYFQQARQIFFIGEQAEKYAYLGKNRLLQLESVRKRLNEKEKTSKTFDDIFKVHPYNGDNGDSNISGLKAHVDAVITYYRFKSEELVISFSEAIEWAQKRGVITVGAITEVKGILAGQEEEEKRKKLLTYYVKNGKFDDKLQRERNFPQSFLNFVKDFKNIDFEKNPELVKKLCSMFSTYDSDSKKSMECISKFTQAVLAELESKLEKDRYLEDEDELSGFEDEDELSNLEDEDEDEDENELSALE